VAIGVALVIVVRRAVDELARQLSGEYERLAELDAGSNWQLEKITRRADSNR
jgi:hypothetical protein